MYNYSVYYIVCVCAYMYVYAYARVYVRTYTCVCLMCAHICYGYVCMLTYICVYACVCLYVHLCVCTRVWRYWDFLLVITTRRCITTYIHYCICNNCKYCHVLYVVKFWWIELAFHTTSCWRSILNRKILTIAPPSKFCTAWWCQFVNNSTCVQYYVTLGIY